MGDGFHGNRGNGYVVTSGSKWWCLRYVGKGGYPKRGVKKMGRMTFAAPLRVSRFLETAKRDGRTTKSVTTVNAGERLSYELSS